MSGRKQNGYEMTKVIIHMYATVKEEKTVENSKSMLSDNFMLVEKIENDQGRIQTVLSKVYSSKLRLWGWNSTGTSRLNGIILAQKRPFPGSVLMYLAFKIIYRSQTW